MGEKNETLKVLQEFDGIGDPFDHLAQFRHSTFVERIINVYTMVKGIGTIMVDKVLTWFRILKPKLLNIL